MAPYEGLDGFKTGTIAEAGYCVTTTAVRDGRRVIAVVMKSTSDAQRFADSRQLLDYGFAEIQKRDAARKTTSVQLTAAPDSVRPYQPFTVTARLEGVSASYACKAQWYVNGAAVDGYGNSSFLTADYKTSTLQYTLKDLSGDTLDIAFVLTMFDGTEIRCETALPVEQRPVRSAARSISGARHPIPAKRCSLPRISPAKTGSPASSFRRAGNGTARTSQAIPTRRLPSKTMPRPASICSAFRKTPQGQP